jgi:hypothetical protein
VGVGVNVAVEVEAGRVLEGCSVVVGVALALCSVAVAPGIGPVAGKGVFAGTGAFAGTGVFVQPGVGVNGSCRGMATGKAVSLFGTGVDGAGSGATRTGCIVVDSGSSVGVGVVRLARTTVALGVHVTRVASTIVARCSAISGTLRVLVGVGVRPGRSMQPPAILASTDSPSRSMGQANAVLQIR